jgi:Holliday junction resolvase RusA-like endonuclease
MKTVIRLQHVPPSTNNLFVNVRGKGRVKSERYRTWLQAAGWDLARFNHNQRWNEPVYLTIAIGNLRANADVSNRVKAIEDLLVVHKIIPGDSIQWVKGVNVYLAQEPFDGVEIAITPATPEQMQRRAA